MMPSTKQSVGGRKCDRQLVLFGQSVHFEETSSKPLPNLFQTSSPAGKWIWTIAVSVRRPTSSRLFGSIPNNKCLLPTEFADELPGLIIIITQPRLRVGMPALRQNAVATCRTRTSGGQIRRLGCHSELRVRLLVLVAYDIQIAAEESLFLKYTAVNVFFRHTHIFCMM